MPATQTEDISTEAKYNSYTNYENATLAKKSSSATFRMAQLYFRDGLYEKAVNLALKDENPDIPVMYVIAIGSRLMGNNDRSIDYYARILSQDENQAEAKLGMGIAYKSKGDFSKALGYLRDYNSTHADDEVKKEITILNTNLNKLYLYGRRMKFLYDRIKENSDNENIKNIETEYFESKELIKEKLEQIKSEKVILIKASRGMKLEDVIG